MSYKVLARRWRPQRFNDLIGQDVVVQTLQNALQQKKTGHAYLFCGIRGVGKTTLARLMSMALNCEQSKKKAEPCGSCASCHAITEGSTLDILEMDAASHTGVDDIRELMDNVRYPPVNLRNKVYIIDEAHMLSKSAFNALLKTLEEPPEHIVFILATTEAEKLPVTVRSRCQRFDLRCLSIEEIQAYLKKVLHTENIDAQDQALFEIARAAQGSVRDALSLTERVMAFAGHVHLKDVQQSIGLLADIYRCRLSDHIFQGQSEKAILCLRDIANQGHSLHTSLQSLSELWHQLACTMISPNLVEREVDSQTRTWLTKWQGCWTHPQLDMRYQVLIRGFADLHLMDERCGAEMLVIRLAGLQLLDASQSPIEQDIPTHKTATKITTPSQQSPQVHPQEVVAKTVTPTKEAITKKEPSPAITLDLSPPSTQTITKPQQLQAEDIKAPHNWEEALQAYSRIKPGLAAQLEQVAYDDDGTSIHLALSGHLQRMIGSEERKNFEAWFQRPLQWQAQHQKKVDSVSVQRQKRQQQEEEKRYRDAEENPHIKKITQKLGGRIIAVHPPGQEI
ncbi:MAG: DNA polymerase III subunit gamma/tau [Mariprofundaceae bacterium]|nr:DNA polymerase III subunit gamma/tau [Mariprofundaceae bacterium]